MVNLFLLILGDLGHIIIENNGILMEKNGEKISNLKNIFLFEHCYF